jgi:glycosyltransferase involved in cell wall biosynthesis
MGYLKKIASLIYIFSSKKKKYTLSQYKSLSFLYYYFQLNRFQNKKTSSPKKVLFDLHDGTPDRYLYSLIAFFAFNNYSIFLKANYNFLATCNGLYLENIFRHLGINKLKKTNNLSEFNLIITDCNKNSYKIQTGIIELKNPLGTNQIQMPFSMHPTIYIGNKITSIQMLENYLDEKRKSIKKLRLLFAGNYNNPLYKNLKNNFPSYLNRNELINFIISKRKSKIENKIPDISTPYKNKFILIHRDNATFQQYQWLNTLSKSDFFLCPPGFEMPFSHNLIEAMACGVIPVLEYGNLLSPPLKDMENCILFKGKEELIAKIDIIFNLNDEIIQKLRKNVIEYYHLHLSPKNFLKKIEAETKQKFLITIIGGVFSFGTSDTDVRK